MRTSLTLEWCWPAIRRCCSFCGLLFVLISAFGNDEDLLSRWLASQQSIKAWSAEFTQVRTFPTLSKPLETPGRVVFEAPSSFRWELGIPARTIAVRSEHSVTIYYPRLKRAERYPLGDEAKGPWRDAMILLDAGFPRSREELEKRFVMVEVKKEEGLGHLVLRPRSIRARRMLPRLRFKFSLETLELKESEFEFADGSIMRNEYRKSESNPSLDEHVFSLPLPGDVTVKGFGDK